MKTKGIARLVLMAGMVLGSFASPLRAWHDYQTHTMTCECYVEALLCPSEWDYVLIRVRMDQDLTGLNAVVIPRSKNLGQITVGLFENPVGSGVFEGRYYPGTGWGNIKEIRVTGYDWRGNKATSSGTFSKRIVPCDDDDDKDDA